MNVIEVSPVTRKMKALQFQGFSNLKELFRFLRDCRENEEVFSVLFRGDNCDNISVLIENRRLAINVGDWVVRDPRREKVIVYTDAAFAKEYVRGV